MNKNNLQLPVICICNGGWSYPELGIFRECFGVKSREITKKQLVNLGVLERDDLFQRGGNEYYLIYQGKRPNLRKIINKIGWIESYE